MVKFSKFTIFGGVIVVIAVVVLIFGIDWADLKTKREIESLQLQKQKIIPFTTGKVNEPIEISTYNDCINLFPIDALAWAAKIFWPPLSPAS